MYNWYLKYRDDNGANLFNPDEVKLGYGLSNGNENENEYRAVTFFIAVQPGQTYNFIYGSSTDASQVAFYDLSQDYVSTSFEAFGTPFTVPSGVYYLRFTMGETYTFENVGIMLGSSTPFEFYYTTRQAYPIYKKLDRGYQLESSYQFYREKLDGNLKFMREDYDFLDGVSFDTKIKLIVVDSEGRLNDYKAYFYKTDCKWNANDRIVEVKTNPDDYYEDVLGGLEKTFNLIELAPALNTINIRRRPLIQVYIAGDTVVTNLLGGTYWEQEIQTDPIFDHSTLTNTYRFFNTKNTRLIPTGYASTLSTDVTGEYDDSNLSPGGTYELFEQTNSYLHDLTRRRYFIAPAGSSADFDGSWNSTALYKTGFTNWRKSGVNLLQFNGTNGEVGSFYFTEYRIYCRYYTDLLDVRGTSTYAVPSEDIVDNNINYRRVIGFDIPDRFYVYDQFVYKPNKFGKVPEGAPNAGQYYKEFLVSASSGLSNPLPVSSSNWRAVSLWFFNDLNIRYTEFIDGQDYTLRDAYNYEDVLSVLLNAIGSTVTHAATTKYSEFLYSDINPLGGFTYLDFEGGIGVSYAGNLKWHITQKSNIISGNYDQPAQKAEITLGQALNMMRDIFKIYWHIEDGKLRLEHISWYQRGGSYGADVVGADLTTLTQPRNNKKWGFAQNKWEFDKEAMPERFEYGWMDDVSKPFKGYPINILSRYVQKGRIEDLNVNGVTTDVDFVQANAQEISKDGFCLMCTVSRSDKTFEESPLSEYDGDSNTGTHEVGMIYTAQEDVYFGRVQTKIKVNSNTQAIVRLWIGSGTTPATATLLETHTLDNFNSDVDSFADIEFNQNYLLEQGQKVFVTVRAADGSNALIKKWISGGGNREKFTHRTSAGGSWNVASNYGTFMKLYLKPVRQIPFTIKDMGNNQEVVMQNGFLSWLYLHPRYHTYDLPSDKANVNGNDVTLYQNKTRQKKQEVVFPIPKGTTLDPYKLIRTQLGYGIVDKLSINIDSYVVKATIKHDTE